MTREARRAAWTFAGLLAFSLISWAAFVGYLTPSMMVYFLSFKWCL